MRALRRLVSLLETIAVVGLLAVAASQLVPRLFGLTPYAVLSGSMEPELPVGSTIYVKAVDPAQLVVGDTATFYRSDGAVVTHQIAEIDAAAQAIATQGIANKNSDGTVMRDAETTPFSKVIGTPVICVPYLGFVVAWCTTLPGLFVVVAVLLLLFGASALLNGKDKE